VSLGRRGHASRSKKRQVKVCFEFSVELHNHGKPTREVHCEHFASVQQGFDGEDKATHVRKDRVYKSMFAAVAAVK
jgi:hypothetical protein